RPDPLAEQSTSTPPVVNVFPSVIVNDTEENPTHAVDFAVPFGSVMYAVSVVGAVRVRSTFPRRFFSANAPSAVLKSTSTSTIVLAGMVTGPRQPSRVVVALQRTPPPS